MSKTASRLAMLFAVVGLLASVTASYVHYRLLRDPTYVSFCDVSATVSCTQVYASRFSTVLGMPVALFGGIWFTLAALMVGATMGPRPALAESVPGYLFAGSTVALAVCLYLAYVSFVLIKAVCPVCLLTYAAVIGLFIVSGAATSFPMLSLPRRAVHDLKLLVSSPLALVVSLLFLGGAASTLAFFPRDTPPAPGEVAASQDQSSELERLMATAPRVPLVIPAEGAKVLIVKFNDFQCPACSQSYQLYKAILAKYQVSHPGAVRVVLKDFPLNPDCNPNVTVMLHPGACAAAVAVRLARLRGRGEAMEEWLYTHQQGLTAQIVKDAARDVAQLTDFDAKYAATLEGVKADIALGRQLQVKSTPTFFINGVKVDGAWAPQFFDQAIAYELAHAK